MTNANFKYYVDTKEYNKIILTFMNVTIRDGRAETKYERYSLKDLKYHRSYSMLMDVVEFIERKNVGIKICRKVVEVYMDSTKDIIVRRKERCKFESLYLAIVDFINLYNQDPSKYEIPNNK